MTELRNTLATRILTTPLVASGEPFRPAQLATYLGENKNSIKQTLADLRARDLLTSDTSGTWVIVRRHWINRTRLAKPVHDPRRDVA